MDEYLIKWVWKLELPVPNWKFVLLAMASHVNTEIVYEGGIDRLSEMTGLHRVVINNAIFTLSSMGILMSTEGGWQVNATLAARTPQIDS